MSQNLLRIYTLFLLITAALVACDPLTAEPTRQVIVITAVPSATVLPTNTPAITRTPIPTLTPVITPSATPFPCDEESGQVIKFDKFPSAVAGGENLRYRVYVPPCYQKSGARYPVVILLHGSAESELQWDKLGLIPAADQGFRLGVLPPMILVMPYTGSIGNDNTFPPDPSYETVILDEVLPAVERDFCTWANREHRAIGGISRGGFWAYSIALRHPDVFGVVGGHSPFMTEDLSLVPPAFNPLELALNSSFLPDARLRIYLDNGAGDPIGRQLELFSSRLTSRNIPHTYVINPVGEHNNEYWAAHMSEYLAFYGKPWPRNASELPGCAQPSPR